MVGTLGANAKKKKKELRLRLLYVQSSVQMKHDILNEVGESRVAVERFVVAQQADVNEREIECLLDFPILHVSKSASFKHTMI